MTALRLAPPDDADWTIGTEPTADGVALAIAFRLDGRPVTARFALDRSGALALSDSLRAAAGDGAMRTFPRPAIEEA